MSLLWYQNVFKKSPILSLSLNLGLFFISIHQQCMLFWIGIGHTSINVVERENQIGAWSRSCLWLYHTKRLCYKPRTSWPPSISTSAKNYFQNSLRQTSKYTSNEIENWCNFTVSFIICLFFKLQVWTMKLTESTDTCTSDRVACTIEVNIKKTFIGNEGFLQMFMWTMDCS